MSSVDGKFVSPNVTKVSGDDLADSAWNMGPKKAQLNYSSGSDNFTFEVRQIAGVSKNVLLFLLNFNSNQAVPALIT